MAGNEETTLEDIIRLIEWPEEPCRYIVFRNGVLIPPHEYELYADYEVEMLDTRNDVDGISNIVIYLI